MFWKRLSKVYLDELFKLKYLNEKSLFCLLKNKHTFEDSLLLKTAKQIDKNLI